MSIFFQIHVLVIKSNSISQPAWQQVGFNIGGGLCFQMKFVYVPGARGILLRKNEARHVHVEIIKMVGLYKMINVFQFTRSFAMKVLSFSLKDSLDILQSYMYTLKKSLQLSCLQKRINTLTLKHKTTCVSFTTFLWFGWGSD